MSISFALAAPVSTHASIRSAVGVTDMSAGRLGAIVAALTALIGVGIGAVALARSTGRMAGGDGRNGARVALATGPFGIVLGGVVVAGSDGGLGTG